MTAPKTPAAPKKPLAPAPASGLGLAAIGDLSGLLNQATSDPTGLPLDIPLDLIDEDPQQPRGRDNPGFSPESLRELAGTIRLRGIKTPISVRQNPAVSGRFIINHGARRVRASRMAEKLTIAAFIDNDYNEADQVVENLQRNDLTPREISDYIGRELAKGYKKADIARSLGKSASFITQHVTLLDLPDPIAAAFSAGRTGDVTIINELVTAWKRKPDEVTEWLADEEQEITRGTVRELRAFLDDKNQQERERRQQQEQEATQAGGQVPPPAAVSSPDGGASLEDPADPPLIPGALDAPKPADDDPSQPSPPEPPEPKPTKVRAPADPDTIRKAIVQVRHDDRPARLVLDRRPPAPGVAWIKYDDDGHEVEADLAAVQLAGIVEGGQ